MVLQDLGNPQFSGKSEGKSEEPLGGLDYAGGQHGHLDGFAIQMAKGLLWKGR